VIIADRLFNFERVLSGIENIINNASNEEKKTMQNIAYSISGAMSNMIAKN